MLSESQREHIDVVLVSPRNPLNIGAVARAMANFGFSHLKVISPYEPHWREARSAVRAPELLNHAQQVSSLSEAVHKCTLVLGTGTVARRKPEQAVLRLDALGPLMTQELERGGRIGLVFGPEKHGLTREDLSYCHALVEIPTDERQPSMNLGQAAAVCLYELVRQPMRTAADSAGTRGGLENHVTVDKPSAMSGNLDTLAGLIEETMIAAHYSPNSMQMANRHDLRLTLRRMRLSNDDTRRAMGLFRRILRSLAPNLR